jgi:hypothetical protein
MFSSIGNCTKRLHRVVPPIDERVHGFAEVGAALKALPEGQHFG